MLILLINEVYMWNHKDQLLSQQTIKIVVNNGNMGSGNYNYSKNIWQNNKNMI